MLTGHLFLREMQRFPKCLLRTDAWKDTRAGYYIRMKMGRLEEQTPEQTAA
jgi:hypothetical protein